MSALSGAFTSTMTLASEIILDAQRTADWVKTVLRSNLTYFRVRREMFTAFVGVMDATVVRRVSIDDELFIALKQFLTMRNDSMTDDKRLSFDKAVMELRSAAAAALAVPEAAVGAP